MSHTEASNLAMIQHSRLNENPKFMRLRRYLVQYYKDRSKDRQMHIDRSLFWRDSLYKSLQSLMTQLVRTESVSIQLSLLDKTHDWFMNQTCLSLPPIHKKWILKPLDSPKSNFSIPLAHKGNRHSHGSPYVPKEQSASSDSPIDKKIQEYRKPEDLSLTTRQSRNSPIDKKQVEQLLSYSTPEDIVVKKDIPPVSNTARVFDFRETSSGKLDTLDTLDQHKRKVFHSNYSEMSPERKAQFREVLSVKFKFASKSIFFPAKKLEEALVLPDITYQELSPKNLPGGGEGLMSKPIVEDKTTKRKGRQRKKAQK